MMQFDFDGPPMGYAAINLSTECERQLLPLLYEIVEAAVAAGWSRDDILLALVELTWDMYEERSGDS
jgi:hypothetical protein